MLICLFLICLLVCALFAHQIADQKQAGNRGFWLGFFFGPAGVIAAGFMDGRPQCPHCGGRLNDTKAKKFSTCPSCRADFAPVSEASVSVNASLPDRKEPKPQVTDQAGSFRHLLYTERGNR